MLMKAINFSNKFWDFFVLQTTLLDKDSHAVNNQIEWSCFQPYFGLNLIDALCHGMCIESHVPIAYVTRQGLWFESSYVIIHIL